MPSGAQPHIVGRRVAAIREAFFRDKAGFADAIGLDRSSYSKIEKGVRLIPISNALAICELVGVDLDFIYRGRLDGLTADTRDRIGNALRNL